MNLPNMPHKRYPCPTCGRADELAVSEHHLPDIVNLDKVLTGVVIRVYVCDCGKQFSTVEYEPVPEPQ